MGHLQGRQLFGSEPRDGVVLLRREVEGVPSQLPTNQMPISTSTVLAA